MTSPQSCPEECPLACVETCAAHPNLPPVDLNDTLARFAREAVQSTCSTGRYRMPYYSWGEGPPLVFVHGVCDSSRSFLMTISRLTPHFRCIAYELPAGRGDGAVLRRYTHDDLVTDFWALLDHLGLRQSYVLASSFGATIAIKALAARPERLPRAILQGGLTHRRLRRAELFLARLGRFLPGTTAWLPGREKVLAAVNRGLFDHRPPEVWRYFIECTARPRVAAFAHQVLWLHSVDVRPLLPQVRQPVLLLCGDRDRVVPPHYEKVLLEGLPSAGRVVIEGCGHVPSYTHPEVFAEIVRQFLTPS
jgi:pimeloyl-ACP methyl ester carboxylesterase